jgi:hypothetical protein
MLKKYWKFILAFAICLIPVLDVWLLYHPDTERMLEDAVPGGHIAPSILEILLIMLVVLGGIAAMLERRRTLSNVLLSLFMIIAVPVWGILEFAIYYQDRGLIESGTNRPITEPRDFVYFSIVTFTTVGYGDIIPKPETRILAATEALFGYMFIGLYVGILTQVTGHLVAAATSGTRHELQKLTAWREKSDE